MNLLLIFLFGICVAIIIVVVPIQLRRQREAKRQENLNAHLKMLSEGIDRIARLNPDLIGDVADHVEGHTPSKSIRAIWGFPPDEDTVLEEIRIAEAPYDDWDYVVHIHEGAEPYLGTLHFQSLQARFSKIHGIKACKQEDREIFLIRTRQLSADALRKAIWNEFLATAELSHNEKSGR